MKDWELELEITLSNMQSWRAREYVRMLVMGKPVDQYKMLPWMCAAIVKANVDSRAFMELDGCRFKHMFVTFGACLNGFILGSRKMLFVDGTHLSGLYEGTMLAAIALDADNHIFDVAYAVVGGETNENWLWFLTQLHECLSGLKTVVMSDRNNRLLAGIPTVFGKENHAYSVRHVMENFLSEAAKLSIRRTASKNLLKELFNRLAYATMKVEYGGALEELRKFKRQLAGWVERNEPVDAVQIFKGTVGEIEQQPSRKLEQLDTEATAVVHPMVVDWAYLEVGAEMG